MAKPPAYVPDRGDIIWIDFNPQAGHEQAGHRPALVLSPAVYNAKVGLLIACPMATKLKGYPFEVPIAGTSPGAALADQVKSLDWRARGAVFKGRASTNEVMDVRKKLRALV